MSKDFCVLHLSDIHLRGIDDPVVNLSRQIAQKVFHDARDTGACLIVVSGDIAFSGKAEEYDAAKLFLSDIQDAIENEGCGYVDIVVTPGNHDCALIPNDTARDIVIEHIVKKGSVDLDSNIVETCTEAQREFFEFRRAITKTHPLHDDNLWTEYEFNFGGSIVRLSALNAAWMSRNPEKYGELVFPVDSFKNLLLADSAMHLAIVHHPLHWYSESSFHSLRQALQTHCDVVLSGHEHLHSTSQNDMVAVGSCVYFECHALQPHGPDDEAGFSVTRFDQEESQLVQRRFKIDKFKAIGDPSTETIPMPDCGERLGLASNLTDSFQATLRDPGGNFLHPEKSTVYVDDIFVFPEVSDRMSPNDRGISAEKTLKLNGRQNRILFIGDEKSGKTTLLLEAFREWHVQGFYPLYVNGLQIKGKKGKWIEKTVESAAKAEYVDPAFFKSASKEKRMILIDDVDLLLGGHSQLRPLIEYCDKHFSRIVVSATTGYEFAELLDEEAPEALSSFEVYEILNFGYKLRRRLIKKWCASAEIRSDKELERVVHRVEKVMNSVIGYNLIPAQPIFLLILLQSIDQRQEQELQHSGFAFYYQYLITKGLGSAGVHPEDFDALFNYLANLAWYLQKEKIKEIDEVQFRGFNKAFSDKYVSVDFDRRVKRLVAAKIIVRKEELFSFAYPYIHYFFIGKFLADHAQDQEVAAVVEEYCKTLHVRDRANCIVFLTHHRNDLSVIDSICNQLSSCFSDREPLDFGKDTNSLDSLIDSSAELILGEVDTEANQERERDHRDELDREYKDKDKEELVSTGDEEVSAAFDASTKINSLIRTAEIVGQVLKNYYGSIGRPKKLVLMEELFNAPLRMLRFLVEDIIEDPENFAHELHALIAKNKPAEAKMPSEKTTRRLAFNLIGAICTGLVCKTAGLVNSGRLEEDVANLIAENDTISYRLISAAIKLTQPGRVSMSEIQALSKELRDNHFAFSMLQSLGFYYLHMFHVSEVDKQKLCASLKISQKASNLLTGPSSRRRMIPSHLDERKC